MKSTLSKQSVLGITTCAFFLSLLLVTGCSKKEEETTVETKTASGTATASTGGKAIYDANGCANCHTLAGQGGQKAPNLSKVGANRDAQWIADHVKNPKTHNPGSMMPASEGKINDADLKKLGEYLAGLK